jgi:phosphoribosylformylglycinamidine cyclo-ligase
VLERGSWPRDPVFDWLQHIARTDSAAMYRTFNCGIGMVVIVPAAAAAETVAFLTARGERAQVIGQVQAGGRGVVITE